MKTSNGILHAALITLALTGFSVTASVFADGKTKGLGGANQMATQDTPGKATKKYDKGKQIEVESFSWGTSANKPSSAPTESMSLNYGKVKPKAPGKGPDNVNAEPQSPQPTGMLVPAIQKVRAPAPASKQENKEGLTTKNK